MVKTQPSPQHAGACIHSPIKPSGEPAHGCPGLLRWQAPVSDLCNDRWQGTASFAFSLIVVIRYAFYIAQYPAKALSRAVKKHSSHAAITSEDFIPMSTLSIARYSFIQLSELEHHGENENAQTLKWEQWGFKPGFSRLRVWHPTEDLLRS